VKYTLLVLFAAFAALARPQEPPRHDQYRDDAAAYCWNPASSGTQAAKREADPHGHRCACHLSCQIGPDGSIIGDQEDSSCQLYCTRARCQCHVEEPCELPR
jgi:hypothetical protein